MNNGCCFLPTAHKTLRELFYAVLVTFLMLMKFSYSICILYMYVTLYVLYIYIMYVTYLKVLCVSLGEYQITS